MRCIAARLGITYGLSPVMKRDYRFMTAPNKFCLQLVRGEALALYPGSERSAGFIHVADASAALRQVAAHAGFAGYTPVNVATEWTTVASVAAIAGEVACHRGLAAGVPPPRNEALPHIGARLAGAGFTTRHNLRSGLGEVMDYFSDVEGRVCEAQPGPVAR